MTMLTVNYRYAGRYKPSYLSNPEIEAVAKSVRAQLVGDNVDALPLARLNEISRLRVNGLDFELWISLDNPVTDRQTGETVCGLCEIDPDAGTEVALLFVSPPHAGMTDELVLSTFGHELGHALFEAPGWIADSKQGPGLFGSAVATNRQAYRTTTANADHLSKVGSAAAASSLSKEGDRDRDMRFAEYRANEFMGSLLVPRDRLTSAVLAIASNYDVKMTHGPCLLTGEPPSSVVLMADSAMGKFDLDNLQKALGKQFGVHGRFIEVRMDRYGMLGSSRAN
ncbi:MAG: hypothetical protein D4S02_16615 [Rhodocyclaceae bacterium]|nr:MAG: hypothetical protein D4S02_16615 [Rhodocyclaceae bacterium]